MHLDERDFFRQATLRICSSLELKKVFSRCMEYLEDFMPADGMCLAIMEPGLGVVRYLEATSRDDRLTVNPELSIPDTMVEFFSRFNEKEDVQIFNRLQDPEFRRYLTQVIGMSEISSMCLSLEIEGRPLGRGIMAVVAICAVGENRYTEEHARLLSLLAEPFSIAVSNYLKHQEILKFKEMVADDNVFLKRELMHISGDKIVGEGGGLRSVMRMVRQVAPSNTPVLLLGETGVGKEVLANAIHRLSLRKEGPFIKVNCGALADSLLDSELFGHEKGAFTGAVRQRRGRFERAHGGTIFLDEVGELTARAQVRLLRVLEQKEFERVGGATSIPIDVRVISATNRRPEEMADSGRFRQDLWFRLSVFPMTIPPLRERKEDIPLLIDYFVGEKSKELKFPVTPILEPGALEKLKAYPWPGNVRELENLVERAMILNRLFEKPTPLGFEGLFPRGRGGERRDPDWEDQEIVSLDEAARAHILRALALTHGKIFGPGGAAQLLRINPHTLLGRMRKLGMKREGIRSQSGRRGARRRDTKT